MTDRVLPLAAALVLAAASAACDRQQVPAPETADADVRREPPAAAAGAASQPVSQSELYTISAAPTPAGHCSLDQVNDAPPAEAAVGAGETLSVRGWIGDASKRVPQSARLLMDSPSGRYTAALPTGVERPDVAKALAAEDLARSGFSFQLTAPSAPGDYALSILHGPHDAPVACDLRASLRVFD